MRIFWLLANILFLFVDAQPECSLQYLTGSLFGTTGTVTGSTTTTIASNLNLWDSIICNNMLYNNPRDQYSLYLGNGTINGILELSVCDPATNYDTMIFVGTGCPTDEETFSCIGSIDDSDCSYSSLYSILQVSVSKSLNYIIVGGYSSGRGNYRLRWSYIPSAPTMTRSSSVSETVSRSSSVTLSNTGTNTRTNSATSTISRTNTGTESSSKSSSSSITESVTSSNTASESSSRSSTVTVSRSVKPSRSSSASSSASSSSTSSSSNTETSSETSSASNSLSGSASSSITGSQTDTMTSSMTSSMTSTETSSSSQSITSSNSQTESSTSSGSDSQSPSTSGTRTSTRSERSSNSQTRSVRATSSNTAMSTRSRSITSSPSITRSSSHTLSETSSHSGNMSDTKTNTKTISGTRTETSSSIETRTGTRTGSSSDTSSSSDIGSSSDTSSSSGTSSSTGTSTGTSTVTNTGTSTVTNTGTATVTTTTTSTRSRTPTQTKRQLVLPTIRSNISLTDASDIVNQLANISVSNTTNSSEIMGTLNKLTSSLAANLVEAFKIKTSEFTFAALPPKAGGFNISENISVTVPRLTPSIAAISVVSWTSLKLGTTPIDSSILSISAVSHKGDTQKVANLSTPFTFTNTIGKSSNASFSPQCIYWDVNNESWSSEGCIQVKYTNTSITCACNHLTDFAARFASIEKENANMFANAGNVFSAEGLKKYASFYIFTGTFFGILVIIFIYLTKANSNNALVYARTLAKYSELSILKLLSPNPANFFIDRYYPRIKLHPKKLKEISIIHPYKGKSWLERFIFIWKKRILYQHSYLSVFWKFDPRISKQLRGLLLFIVIINTLFITCLLYGYSHDPMKGPMGIAESVVLSVLTAIINIPVIQFFSYVVYTIGIYEYRWRYPYLSQELSARHQFENSLALVKNEEILDELALCMPELLNKIDNILNSEEIFGSKKLRELIEYANIHIKNRDISGKVVKLIDKIPLQGDFKSKTDLFLASLPVHTKIGWIGLISGYIYLIWCFIYILLFGAYQSNSDHIFYNFISTEITNILISQPLILFLTPIINATLGYCLRSSYNSEKTSYSNMYFFSDPDAKKGSSTSLSIGLGYLLFLRGVAETNSNKENRVNMEISVAPSNAIIKSLQENDMENDIGAIETVDREKIIACLYYLFKVRKIA